MVNLNAVINHISHKKVSLIKIVRRHFKLRQVPTLIDGLEGKAQRQCREGDKQHWHSHHYADAEIITPSNIDIFLR